jgi:hypothetical protein
LCGYQRAMHDITTGHTRPTTDPRAPIRVAALVLGIVFLLVGIAGFVPGITSHVDDLEFAGHESGAELLGVFQVSILHNLVHLAFGVAGIAMSRRADTARTYLLGGGAIYLVLFVYGLFIDREDNSNFVPVNNADDFLHLGLGLAMIFLAIGLWRESTGGTASMNDSVGSTMGSSLTDSDASASRRFGG